MDRNRRPLKQTVAPSPVRVLLVDLDQNSDTERALTSAGHVVTRALDFADAKRWLQLAPPDVLMTDVRLGAYNGLHLVIRAHAAHPGMPAIVVDAKHDPVLEREANEAGAAYVAKPLEANSVLDFHAAHWELKVGNVQSAAASR